MRYYSVVLNNDDEVTYSNIVKALRLIFNMTEAEAGEVAIYVHNKGRKVIETVHKEKCELRIEQVKSWKEKGNIALPITFEEVL